MVIQHLGANMKKVLASVATLILVISFQNCSEQKLSGKAADNNSSACANPPCLNLGQTDDEATGVVTQTGGPNCRNQLRTTTLPIKSVFVVDVSGSNKSNNNNQPGSDPNRVVRGDSIQRYYNTYSAKPNFGWSFTTFAASSANVLLAMGNAASMKNAIDTFRVMSDAGETPYMAALNAAQANIQNDTGRAPNTKYMVVFLSDGLPNPPVDQVTLNNKVTQIVNVLPGQVSFNSVYYGAVDPQASGRLQAMAQTGGGNFLDTNANPTGTNFLITDLVVIPGVVCN